MMQALGGVGRACGRASRPGSARQHPAAPSRRSVRASVGVVAPQNPALADQQSTTGRGVSSVLPAIDHNQHVREGHYELDLVKAQASKRDGEQSNIASVLAPLQPGVTSDVAVVGCGPAGLYLAAQLAQRGLSVALIGPDTPFVNNYGVWVDEFTSLGLEGTLEAQWPDALCYFGEQREVRVGRAYGRVSRRALRDALVDMCAAAGVRFAPATVEAISLNADGQSCTLCLAPDGSNSSSSGGGSGGMPNSVAARLVTLASGQAAGRFLQYEAGAPSVASQTAYGIEATVEGYEDGYSGEHMVFMDYRRHHTGLWDGSARHLAEGEHPAAAQGLWGSNDEVPSFLYAMPLGNGRVFLEETCLVAKPALPFATLKRRLERRLAAMGVNVTEVQEQEWSYIPVGGPLPCGDQWLTAFGAAANLVHPATGFSVSRSLREAPIMADAAAAALRDPATSTTAAASAVWAALWPAERRRQSAFHVFGMELLAQLDLAATNAFFTTFFALPSFYWRGFLGSSLSSGQLLAFALLTFVLAPPGIKARLVGHLLSDPAGGYLVKAYLGEGDGVEEGGSSSGAAAGGAAPAAAAIMVAALVPLLEAAAAASGSGAQHTL